ncbi:MAG: hypothetical protein M3144_06650 [Actinomycetota bacterium]|nr:hypothetical protein [Actinomycetota bacterium]
MARRAGNGTARRIVDLQRDAGNRAVVSVLSVQRTSTEQIAQYKQYTTDGDWGRAAWQLATFDGKDIPDHVKGLTPRQLELLTEGARHHGAQPIVDAVVTVNKRSAIIGTVRFHVWKHNWAEAAKYLTGMERSDGRRLEDEMMASGLLDHLGLAQIIKHNGNLKLGAGDAITIGTEHYVVYEKVVRWGGTMAWRNNNPGALKSVEPLFGSIGKDQSNFLIFPDAATGLRAARDNVKFQLFKNPKLPKNRTLLQVMESYAPPGEGPNDPVLYANKIAAAVGVKPEDPVAGFTEPQVEKMVETIVRTETTTPGTEKPHDSPDVPREMRDLL